ncbi:MAG: hypothetical protein ACI9TH_000029 [Kiritimatiellia bacterium]|jgi:hypothetical protein
MQSRMSVVDIARKKLFRSRKGIIYWSIFKNAVNRFRLKPGSKILFMEETPSDEVAQEKVGYIRHMFDEYLCYLPDGVQDKQVLELGPGDNFGVALLCLAHGASSVVCLDKYAAVRNLAFECRVYWKLRETLTGEQQARFDQVVMLDKKPSFDEARLRIITDCPLEKACSRLGEYAPHLILSRSVLEYLKDLEGAFDVMDRLLVPGGTMVHKVDVRDDGLFSASGHHPLTFLTPGDAQYHAMTSHTYRPNRMRVDDFRRQLNRLKYTSSLPITHLLDQEKALSSPVKALISGNHYGKKELERIKAIRPQLAKHFSTTSNEDLLTTGFWLVATKPTGPEVTD